jgi:lactam utilization protein B
MGCLYDIANNGNDNQNIEYKISVNGKEICVTTDYKRALEVNKKLREKYSPKLITITADDKEVLPIDKYFSDE